MTPQVIRFGVVGGAATLTHVLVAMAAEEVLSVPDQAANLSGFLVAVLVSYGGHARLTFGAPLRSGRQFLRFLVQALAGLGASSLTVWAVTSAGFGFPIAMAAVAVVVPTVSYLAMRFWVFADRAG
ncbi:MAG: GtrA family protein [Tabrizicola sp.]